MLIPLVCTFLLAFLLHRLLLYVGRAPGWWGKSGIQEIDASSAATPWQILLGVKSISDRDEYGYRQMVVRGLKYCGMLEKPCPVVLIKDLDLAKKIFIKDFDHFVDRRDFFTVSDRGVIRKFLGFMKGEEWKGVRSTVSPFFTTGKVRRFMEHFNSVGKDWMGELRRKAAGQPLTIQVLPLSNQFTIDVIGKTVFGIDAGSVKDPTSSFAGAANRIIGVNFWSKLRQNLSPRYPTLFKLFGVEFFDESAIKFMEDMVRQSLELRQKAGGKGQRNDFQQMLLEASKGDLKTVGPDELNDFEKEAALSGGKVKKVTLTDQQIVSQSVLFIVAGFFAVSAAISSALHVLAAYPEIQDKLREELEEIVKKDGTLDYDDLGKVPYLDMVVAETLRLFPAFTRLERIATKDYHDPDSGLFVAKGSIVVVPVLAIHHDKEYYDKPDDFDPEHFSAEAKAERNSFAYLPFGAGPRNCIGMRFGVVETKAALAYAVCNFRIECTEKTQMPPVPILTGILTVPPADLELKFTPL